MCSRFWLSTSPVLGSQVGSRSWLSTSPTLWSQVCSHIWRFKCEFLGSNLARCHLLYLTLILEEFLEGQALFPYKKIKAQRAGFRGTWWKKL